LTLTYILLLRVISVIDVLQIYKNYTLYCYMLIVQGCDDCIMFRYKGYCPQLKYNFGKTFGQQTYELSKVSCQEYGILAS